MELLKFNNQLRELVADIDALDWNIGKEIPRKQSEAMQNALIAFLQLRVASDQLADELRQK